MHGAMPMRLAPARSASSSTIVADLPPSSRNSRFIVAAPFSMIRLPTVVEPVNEMRSTFGDSVELLAHEVVRRRHHVDHARRDVGLLGDEPAETGRVERRVGRRLEHHGVAGGQRLADLVDRDLERVVPRHDRAHDADRLPPDLPPGHLVR